MKITNLNPSKYKRFFAFGCSNTNYMWPSWADVIGQDIEFYQNWAEPGGSNYFIFNSVIEANTRYKFNKDDLVIIKWTTKEREGRYSNNKWIHATPGNVDKIYDENWIKQFYFDSRSQLIRDLAYIQAIQKLLENLDCDWANLFYFDIFNFTDSHEKIWIESNNKDALVPLWQEYRNLVYTGSAIPNSIFKDQDVIEMYQEVFTNISGVFWASFEFFYNTPRISPNNDMHATPLESLKFLDWVWPNNTISSTARSYAIEWNNTIFKEDYSQSLAYFRMNHVNRL